MIIQINVSPGENEIFARDAFNKATGKELSITFNGASVRGTLLSADVVEGGKEVFLTIAVEDGEKDG